MNNEEMTNEEMNEKELKQLLGNTPPAPSADAKARALRAAMVEFSAVQLEQVQTSSDEATATPNASPAEEGKNIFTILQGFLHRLRPTHNTNPSRSNNMNKPMSFTPKQLFISGMATCSLAVLGVLVFNNYSLLDQTTPEQQVIMALEKPKSTPPVTEAAEVEEVMVTSLRAEADARQDAKKESAAKANIAEEKIAAREQAAQSMALADAGGLPEVDQSQVLGRMPAAALAVNMPAPTAVATGAVMQDSIAPQPTPEFRDRFEEFRENAVTAVSETPVSTFSIDVDTASYSFVRRQLNAGQLPAKDAVRTEELINYFDYHYPVPASKKVPFESSVTVLDSPWTAGNKLIHIGIKGYQIPAADIPRSNLVFLLDVSGSMSDPDKLPLVQQSMSLLLDNLKPDDTIAIVVYAGAAGTVLEPTPAKERQKILAAINNLQAGGSTAGAEGIALAYQLAEANFNAKAVNRIILATDGDFNVGETGDSNLQDFVERKREKGIFLSVLGFGQGNYQDELMQTLAQNGNGTAAYIDTLSEAQKVLVHEATSTLFPIASDVKIQVEFNPNTVAEYRLLGYETRALNREDFNNDKVDAGEIGSGHSVTAIYEITPVDAKHKLLDTSRYQAEAEVKKAKTNNEYAFLRMRYKVPGETKSQLIEKPINANQESSPALQREAKFATAVAGFAQLLRGSNYTGDLTYDKVIELAQANKGSDEYGYRTEFVQLVRKAKMAKGQ